MKKETKDNLQGISFLILLIGAAWLFLTCANNY